jgi:hypothetical protein
VVNVEKSHFLNLIEILGSYLSIDLNGFAAFKSKLEVEPGKSRQKSMCLAAAQAVAVAAAKLLLVCWISRYCARNLKPNGPAV